MKPSGASLEAAVSPERGKDWVGEEASGASDSSGDDGGKSGVSGKASAGMVKAGGVRRMLRFERDEMEYGK